MKKYFFILSLLLISFNAFSQIDKEFWFAVPAISTDFNTDNSIKLCFTTYDMPTTVIISQPAKAQGFPGINIVHTIPAHSFWVIDLAPLYKPQLEILNGIQLPYGLHITGDNAFSCYYANTTDDSEVYTLKGKNALGTDFIVPMQYEYANQIYYAPAYDSVEILATEDSTVVTVPLSVMTLDPAQTKVPQTITIKLNKGWCYAIAGKGHNGLDHLFNTHITSNKPIAVNSTDDAVAPGDLVGDQLVPTPLAGTSYIALKNLGIVDKVYIFPTQNKTTIYVDGVAQLPVLNIGDKSVVVLNNPATVITSTLPVVAFQLTSNPGQYPEFGGAILPNVECTGSMEAAYKPAFTTLVFDIVTRKENIANFTVCGQAGVLTAANFAPVPGNPAWCYCVKQFLATDPIMISNDSTMRIKNSSGYFQLGVVDYKLGTNSCSFGYISDFHPITLTALSNAISYSSGDNLKLYMQNSSAFTDITWTTPAGKTIQTDTLVISNVTQIDAGIYSVMATSKFDCPISEAGTVVVNIFDTKNDSTSLCSGSSVNLSTAGYGPYTWTPKAVNLSDTSVVTVAPKINTNYIVGNYRSGTNEIVNGDFQQGNATFTSDYTYGGTGTTAVTTPGKYTVWRNAKEVNTNYNREYDHTSGSSTNGRFLIANCSAKAGSKLWTKTQDVTPNTRYYLSAWFIAPQIGLTPAKLRYSINDSIVGNLITPPNTANGTSPSQWKQFTYMWNSGLNTSATISIVTDASTTQGSGACIDDISFAPLFAVTDKFNVAVLAMPTASIKGDTIICQGKANLDAGGIINPSFAYKWYKAGTTTSIGTAKTQSVTTPGKYVVNVFNQICVAIDTFNVAPGNEIKVTLDSIIQICANEPNFTLNYQLLAGELAFYNVLYDSTAKACGFADLNNQPVASGNQIVIPLPNNVKPDTYNANVQVISKSVCGDSKTIPIKITVKIKAADLMAQKWNDVIALFNKANNGGLHFKAYQWYKNGLPMAGETGSYLYLETQNKLNPNDKYSVLLTLDDGTTMLTCDFTPTIRIESISMPTLVSPSQVISLKEMPVSGVATFSDVSGLLYSRQSIDANNAQIEAPARKGWYILDLVSDQESLQFKMIVR